MGPAFSSASSIRTRRSLKSVSDRVRRVAFVHFTVLGQ